MVTLRLAGIVLGGIALSQGVRQANIRYRLATAKRNLAPLPAGSHVVVMGAGVAGLTTAYELCRRGYRVTVVDRRAQVASETSYANAGTLNFKLRTLTTSPENLRRALGHILAFFTGRGEDALTGTASRTNPSGNTFRPPSSPPTPPPSSTSGPASPPDSNIAVSSAVEDVQAFLRDFRVFRIVPSVMRRPEFWRWGINFAVLCFEDFERRMAFANELVRESLEALEATVQRERGLAFHFRQCGSLYLYFDQADFEKELTSLQQARAEDYQLLSRDEAVQREPSLAALPFVGAVLHPHDRLGNCLQFCNHIAERCRQLGARFLMRTNLTKLEVVNGRVVGAYIQLESDEAAQHGEKLAGGKVLGYGTEVEAASQTGPHAPTEEEEDKEHAEELAMTSATMEPETVRPGVQRLLPCDAVVICGGSDSAGPLRSAGLLWLPIIPVRGYSLTGPANPDLQACPKDYVMLDEPLHAIVCRLGPQVRIATHAEISTALDPTPARVRDLWDTVDLFFPHAFADREQVEVWMGRRPMTSDSLPIVDVGTLPNLFLNTGHGGDGWRWSHGTARSVADLVSQGKQPQEYLSLRRFLLL